MTDPLDRVLRLVAEGRLTADEAAPILDALENKGKVSSWAFTPDEAPAAPASATTTTGGTPPRWARIEVRENGRRVVDLRIPISLGRFALARVPGLSKEQIADVEEAVTTGTHGPILDVADADGDGVRIVLE
ncbi:MAG TPA: hypothetical protein VET90_02830 [Candidatus Binatus sp.]|nr:hypothetical protein [Candidatus Dormibacteraeota bacterium]HYL40220.1 hypothetical protein [Candidatus Binatus sp.]